MSGKLTGLYVATAFSGSYPRTYRGLTRAEVLVALGAVPIRWCETHDFRLITMDGPKCIHWITETALGFDVEDDCVEGRPRYDIPEEGT